MVNIHFSTIYKILDIHRLGEYVYTYTHIHWVDCGGHFQFPYLQMRTLRLEEVELGSSAAGLQIPTCLAFELKLSNHYVLLPPTHRPFRGTHDVPDWLLPLREIKR